MFVIAGPSGSGKSSVFTASEFGVDWFNADDAASMFNTGRLPAEAGLTMIDGGVGALPEHVLNDRNYHGITADVRSAVNQFCESFIRGHIANHKSFAVETTLRTDIAIQQMALAKNAGFHTVMFFVGTESVEINIERVRARALFGEHSAPEQKIREVYTRSLENLRSAVLVANETRVYDNSAASQPGHRLAPSMVISRGVADIQLDLPGWLDDFAEYLTGLTPPVQLRTTTERT
jgi:predicted ABC-type ATPase